MKTSRKDGILILKTNKPYKIAVDGNLVDRNTIICREITGNTEGAAFDLEQMFDAAMFDIAAKNSQKEKSQKEKQEEEKKQKAFFDNDRPSNDEIEDQALGLEMIIRMNKVIKISTLTEIFNEFIVGNLISAEGNVSMTIPIWETIHRDDKLRILFWYTAFFVNPLLRLLTISISMVKRLEQGLPDVKETH